MKRLAVLTVGHKFHRLKIGLSWKLNMLIGVILLVTMILFVGLDLFHERQSLIAARAQHLEEIAQHFAWVVQQDDGQDQQRLVMNYEHAINQNGSREYRALILNAHSEVIATTNPQLMGTVMNEQGLLKDDEKIMGEGPTQIFLQGTSRMVAALPVVIRAGTPREEDKILTVLVSGSLNDIRASLKASLITHIFHLLITGLAMMAAINLALSKYVVQPIQILLADMKRMEQGQWTRDLPVTTNDEIGQLTVGYNALGRSLEQTVRRLVRAERLASVALVAIHLNRALKKPIEQIRASAKFLCQHNAFDSDSAQAVGKIFAQTEKMYVISEKFNQDFSSQFQEGSEPRTNGLSDETEGSRIALEALDGTQTV